MPTHACPHIHKHSYTLHEQNKQKHTFTYFPLSHNNIHTILSCLRLQFSRAARLSLKIGGEELALVPYADLMNHNPYRYVQKNRTSRTFDYYF